MSEWTKDEYRIAYGDTVGFMDLEMLRKAFALRDAEIDRLKSALNKYSEDEMLRAKDAEIARLKTELAEARLALRLIDIDGVDQRVRDVAQAALEVEDG